MHLHLQTGSSAQPQLAAVQPHVEMTSDMTLLTHLQVAHCLAVVWQLLSFVVDQPHVAEQVRPALALLQRFIAKVQDKQMRATTA
jgi:hypothetical protein